MLGWWYEGDATIDEHTLGDGVECRQRLDVNVAKDCVGLPAAHETDLLKGDAGTEKRGGSPCSERV
jgi:hypothetical protein